MNCKELKEVMTDYMGGTLCEELAGALEAHLSTCLQCAELVSELDSTSSLVRSLDRVAMPAGFDRRLKERLAAQTGSLPKAAASTILGRPIRRLVEVFAGLTAAPRLVLRPAITGLLLCVLLVGSAFMLLRGKLVGQPEMDWAYIDTCRQQHTSFAAANPLADDSAVLLKERVSDLEEGL